MPTSRKVDAQTKRVLSDSRLSLRAKGLWCVLAENHATRVNADELALSVTEGRDAIRTAINALVSRNYLIRERSQNPDSGRWSTETRPNFPTTDSQGSGKRVTTFRPKTGSQSSGKRAKSSPTPGKPTPDNQALIYNSSITTSEEYLSNKKNKKKKIKRARAKGDRLPPDRSRFFDYLDSLGESASVGKLLRHFSELDRPQAYEIVQEWKKTKDD